MVTWGHPLWVVNSQNVSFGDPAAMSASVFFSVCKLGMLTAPNSQRSHEGEINNKLSYLLNMLTAPCRGESPRWQAWGAPEGDGQVRQPMCQLQGPRLPWSSLAEVGESSA